MEKITALGHFKAGCSLLFLPIISLLFYSRFSLSYYLLWIYYIGIKVRRLLLHCLVYYYRPRRLILEADSKHVFRRP